LTKEYFYKNPISPDGFIDKCKSCQKKNNLQRYYDKNKNLNKIYDVNGKSKVPTLKKPNISKYKMDRYKKDIDLIALIFCRNCGKIHELKNKFYTYNCECSKNLIIFGVVNFLYSKILYISDKVEDYSLRTFDKYK